MEILALIQAATALAPVLQGAVADIEASVNGQPISAAQADGVFATLDQAAARLPLLSPVLPIVQKQFNGEALTAEDLVTMESVSTAIDQAIATKTAEIERAGAPVTSVEGASTAETATTLS